MPIEYMAVMVRMVKRGSTQKEGNHMISLVKIPAVDLLQISFERLEFQEAALLFVTLLLVHYDWLSDLPSMVLIAADQTWQPLHW